MRRSIYLYLFLFAALWIVFQYVHNSKYSANAEKRIVKLENKLANRDSIINSLQEKVGLNSSFTLEGNVNAQDYFERSNKTVQEIIAKVSDAVIEKNTPKGNDLVPFEGDTHGFLVNGVQILNHRWLIADFADGSNWGEILVRYFINEDGTIDFEGADELLY